MDLVASQLRLTAELVTWRVCLDIALIAMGFFLLYHTVRASGTWKIVLGVLLSVGVFSVAKALDLKGLEWIFSNLAGVAVLGLIVVFQPEVRKILERAASLRRTPPRAQAASLADVLAEASFVLAAQKRGALLVLPGREPLHSRVSDGIALHAAPSLPLLLSLFDPHSPGHDGAVIVSGGRLTHFAVRLPLSTSGSLGEEFGTRHHAAQGLCEATDALVIAVSEERGSVSAFVQGEMSAVGGAPELAARIADHWAQAGSSEIAFEVRHKTWRVVRQAAVSLAAAILFWTTVVTGGTRIVETGFTVPVEYTAAPPSAALAGDKPSEIKIHVSGPASDLDRVIPSQLPVTVDLSRAAPGRHRIPITSENLRLPRGVRLLGADPASVEVVVTALEQRKLAVKPRIIGRPPRGVRLLSIETTPATVRVLAPEGEPLAPLTTAPVDLGSLRESTTLTRGIVASPGVRPLGDAWPEIEVTVRLAGRPSKRGARLP